MPKHPVDVEVTIRGYVHQRNQVDFEAYDTSFGLVGVRDTKNLDKRVTAIAREARLVVLKKQYKIVDSNSSSSS